VLIEVTVRVGRVTHAFDPTGSPRRARSRFATSTTPAKEAWRPSSLDFCRVLRLERGGGGSRPGLHAAAAAAAPRADTACGACRCRRCRFDLGWAAVASKPLRWPCDLARYFSAARVRAGSDARVDAEALPHRRCVASVARTGERLSGWRRCCSRSSCSGDCGAVPSQLCARPRGPSAATDIATSYRGGGPEGCRHRSMRPVRTRGVRQEPGCKRACAGPYRRSFRREHLLGVSRRLPEPTCCGRSLAQLAVSPREPVPRGMGTPRCRRPRCVEIPRSERGRHLGQRVQRPVVVRSVSGRLTRAKVWARACA
jgi:hypothetical protein